MLVVVLGLQQHMPGPSKRCGLKQKDFWFFLLLFTENEFLLLVYYKN